MIMKNKKRYKQYYLVKNITTTQLITVLRNLCSQMTLAFNISEYSMKKSLLKTMILWFFLVTVSTQLNLWCIFI